MLELIVLGLVICLVIGEKSYVLMPILFGIFGFWILRLQDEIKKLRGTIDNLTFYLDIKECAKEKILPEVKEVSQPKPTAKKKTAPINEISAKVNYDALKENEQLPVKKKTVKPVATAAQTQKKVEKKETVQPWQTANFNRVENNQEEESFNLMRGKSPIVWLAGIAAVLGVFYLVRFLVVHGILGPGVRLTLLAISGAVSVVCGALLFRKKDFADHERIGQVLMGVGVTALYFCSYALSKLYFFAPESVSFVLMCVTTILAIFLTLKFGGEPIALLSMLGGFLTPLLVSGISLHISFFTGYMVIFTGAFLFVATALTSPLLFLVALVGAYVWGFCRLFFFDFYAFDSLWFMLFSGMLAVMTIRFSEKFKNEDMSGIKITSLVLCGFFALSCLIKANFGLLEWGICGLMLAAIEFLTLCKDEKYLPVMWGTALVLLLLMIASMQGLGNNLTVYILIGSVAILPVCVFLIYKFPHELFSLYLGIMMAAYYGGAYFLFGSGWLLSLYGIFGGAVCLLPLLSAKLKTTKAKNCAGILVLSAVSMITFGLCSILDSDTFVILSVVEILVLSAATRTKVNYILNGIIGLLVWYVFLMRNAVINIIVLLLPLDLGIAEFHAADLTVNAFLSYWIIPFACFAGSLWLFKNEDGRRLMRILTGIVGLSGAFMLIIVGKMHYLGETIYEIEIAEYSLITDMMLAFALLLQYYAKQSRTEVFVLFWAMLRMALMGLILFTSFYRSKYLSYGGVMAVLGIPMLLMGLLLLKDEARKSLMVNGLLVYSFVLVTALLNVAIFNSPKFGYGAGSGGIFAYSAVWFMLGVVWLVIGCYYKTLVKPAFGMIYFVIAKVFLYDVSALNDFWRIISLFALAGALLAVSHFYSKYFKEETA